jgi:hypothetical protein
VNAVIPPVAQAADENLHVYEGGSNAVASLWYSAWLRAVPPMLLSRRISVQSAGGVITAPPERRTVTAAIIISPPAAAGLGIVSDVDREGDRPEELGAWRMGPNAYPVSPSPTKAALAAGAPKPSMYSPRNAVQARIVAARRGRLPNMHLSSAFRPLASREPP